MSPNKPDEPDRRGKFIQPSQRRPQFTFKVRPFSILFASNMLNAKKIGLTPIPCIRGENKYLDFRGAIEENKMRVLEEKL